MGQEKWQIEKLFLFVICNWSICIHHTLLKYASIFPDVISSLQVLSRVAGRATTPSCSGCWCRWSCGCSLCRVRRELRRSSTVPCQTKPSNTAGATSWTAGRLPCGRLPETPAWPRSCGRPVRGWWSWPDGRDVDADSRGEWEGDVMFVCLFYPSSILARETATTASVWTACKMSGNKTKEGRERERHSPHPNMGSGVWVVVTENTLMVPIRLTQWRRARRESQSSWTLTTLRTWLTSTPTQKLLACFNIEKAAAAPVVDSRICPRDCFSDVWAGWRTGSVFLTPHTDWRILYWKSCDLFQRCLACMQLFYLKWRDGGRGGCYKLQGRRRVAGAVYTYWHGRSFDLFFPMALVFCMWKNKLKQVVYEINSDHKVNKRRDWGSKSFFLLNFKHVMLIFYIGS